MDIIAVTSFDRTFTHPPSPKNRVCISFYQRFQRFAIDDTDGTLVCTGLDAPFHFPSRQINMNLFSRQLTPRHLFRLIDSRLHDRALSRRIAEKIAAEAVQYVGFLQPYVMSVYVVKTQQVVSLREEEEEESTCAICLEGLYKNDETFDLPYCSHRFHSTCIGEWLQSHDSCPLCREILLEEYSLSYLTCVEQSIYGFNFYVLQNCSPQFVSGSVLQSKSDHIISYTSTLPTLPKQSFSDAKNGFSKSQRASAGAESETSCCRFTSLSFTDHAPASKLSWPGEQET